MRSLLAGLRSALANENGRLQLSLSSQPPGPPALLPTASGDAQAPAEELLDGGDGPLSPARSTTAGEAADATGVSPADADDDVALAAAAERHRLTNLSSSVDLRAVAVALERGLPYAVLLLLLFCAKHVLGLTVCAYLSFVVARLNAVIQSQVALKQDRQARPLLAAAVVAAAQLPLVLLALRGQDLARNLVLRGTRPPTEFWDVVLVVVVGDSLLRCVAVLAKIGVLLSAPVDSPARFRRRGHVLTAVEYCAAAYRMLPPAPLWYRFFAQSGVGGVLQAGLSGGYLLVKAQHFFERASLAGLAVRQLAAHGYGAAATPEETREAGGCCAICQEAYREPIKLPCGHFFCADCCGEWFERERTCPMCRAAVGPANKRFRSAADGRTPLLPIVF